MIHIRRNGHFRSTSIQISDKESTPKTFYWIKRFVIEFQGEPLGPLFSFLVYFRRHRHFKPFSPKKTKIKLLRNPPPKSATNEFIVIIILLKKYPWPISPEENRWQHLGDIATMTNWRCWWQNYSYNDIMVTPLVMFFYVKDRSKTSQIDK